MSLFLAISSRIRSQMQLQGGGDINDPDHQSRQATRQNMSSLEQDIKKQILGRSKAEKTFRPWWDTLEDYLLNSLVLLGKSIIVVNFAIRAQWEIWQFLAHYKI